MRPMWLLFGSVAVATASLLTTLAPAKACGGFFCDSTQPVNQAAERIIFSRGDDGQVTAVIQILYEGPAERFAWMLPVSGRPDISVSSDLAFTRLQQATNPRYQLNVTVEGNCRSNPESASSGGADASASMDTAGPPSPSPNGVQVVDQGTVGPYDFVIISVDSGMSAPASVAVEWLRDNGFDINDFGAERIGPYLESGMNLLSFRLTKGNDTGSIRPVIIGFGSGLASIPIRPTAVAAEADMGVMVWVVGPHPAFPVNYAALELNEALINWFNPTPGYNSVVTAAANQGGGQGFVTEMSGPARDLTDVIFPVFEEAEWLNLRNDPARLRTRDGLQQAIGLLRSHDGIGDALSASLVLPEGTTIQDILSCPFCGGWAQTDENGAIRDFDVATVIAAVDSGVIEPMRATRALFQRPFVTRFYTTMSADEMTVDPSFDFNPDLPQVEVTRQASQVIECSDAYFRNDAPWRVVLRNGQIVRGFARNWPFLPTTSNMPANTRIFRQGPTGLGETIVDNRSSIADEIAVNNAAVQRRIAEVVHIHPTNDGGCAGGPAGPLGTGLGGAFAWLFLRRSGRRRNVAD
jgi:hypothetical protein